MTVRFVYFDLGNVLIRFSVHRMLTQIARTTEQEPEYVKSVLFDKQCYRAYEKGEISTEDFLAYLGDKLGIDPRDEQFSHAFNDIFWANDPILPIARKLAKLNFPRGILSNSNQLHWKYLEEAFPRIWDFFPDHKLVSFEVKALKPYSEIYKIAYENAKRDIPDLKPEETLFIDDLEANVVGAKEFGFQTIQYTDFETFLNEYKTFNLPVPSRYIEN